MDKVKFLKIIKAMQSIGYNFYIITGLQKDLPESFINESSWLELQTKPVTYPASFNKILVTKNVYSSIVHNNDENYINQDYSLSKMKIHSIDNYFQSSSSVAEYKINDLLMTLYFKEYFSIHDKKNVLPIPFLTIPSIKELSKIFDCHQITHILSTLPISSQGTPSVAGKLVVHYINYMLSQDSKTLSSIDEPTLAKAYIKTKNQHFHVNDDNMKKFEQIFKNSEIIKLITPHSRFLFKSTFSLEKFKENLELNPFLILCNPSKMSQFMNKLEHSYFQDTYENVFKSLGEHYNYKLSNSSYPTAGNKLFTFIKNSKNKTISPIDFWNDIETIYSYAFINKIEKEYLARFIPNILEQKFLEENTNRNPVADKPKKTYKF